MCKITNLPIIRTLYQWWNNRVERKELEAASRSFSALLKTPENAVPASLLSKAPLLIDRSKNNCALKKEVGKLERIFLTYQRNKGCPLPVQYLAVENRELVEKCVRMGMTREFLQAHPEFLMQVRERFWTHYFPFVGIPIQMVGNELYLPFEVRENSRQFAWKPWAEIAALNLDDYRVTYQGFAIGHSDRSSRLVPLKTVDSQGKYALQLITACPTGRALPSGIDFKASGHSFTQIILPQGERAEVYSVGFYPRKVADFGMRYFKTVPGVYRNHDSNVSRILAKQVVPIVKQYLFQEDAPNNPCLFSIVQNIGPICALLQQQGLRYAPITFDQIDKAMFDRNEPELDRILIMLTEIRKQIAAGRIQMPAAPMGREEKARLMIRRFEEAQGKHSYHMLGANCTAVSYRQESFAVAFLDAVLDQDKPIRVYDTQVDIRDHKFGWIDRLINLAERLFLHFFAALPLTGPLLGTGSTHPEAKRPSSNWLVPAILSETAAATHQLLIAPFTKRPLFPAGEIMAHNTPVIQPPGFYARLKYLCKRGLLLKQN